MKLDLQQFKHECFSLVGQSRCLVALSGGVDSVVLLHLLKQLRSLDSNLKLRAVHINHQLSMNADGWQQQCKTLCDAWQIPFESQSVMVDRTLGLGTEAAARLARYKALTQICEDDECILTGHHQLDQAETLLLQLIRGAGVKGLSAMAKSSLFDDCHLVRPLLSFTKTEILVYAKENGLQWTEDTSNHDMVFDRNYVRHQLMPIFQARWPSVSQTISRAANHCAEADALLTDYLKQDLVRIQSGNQLVISLLTEMSVLKQSHLLRLWLTEQGCPLPDTNQLQAMLTDVVNTRCDAMPCMHWKGYEMRRFNDRLYVMLRLEPFDSSLRYSWSLDQDCLIEPLAMRLSAQSSTAISLREKYQVDRVSVRFRQGGERMQRQGHHQSLKKFFQQVSVPPWQRDRTPLLFIEEDLVEVYCDDSC